jgi:ankyrin repeat protein
MKKTPKGNPGIKKGFKKDDVDSVPEKTGMSVSDQRDINDELLEAVVQGDCDSVKSLIEAGASIDYTGSSERSLLHLAVLYRKYDVVELLLDNGANIFSQNDEEEQTPLHYASNDTAMFKLLVNRIRGPSSARIKKLIERSDEKNNTVVHKAAFAGNVDIIQYCIKLKLDIDQPNYYSFTPLHFAAMAGKAEAVKTLIMAGADVNSTTAPLLGLSGGYSALHFAVKKLCPEVVQILVSSGADVNLQDNSNSTPLEILERLTDFPKSDKNIVQQIRNSLTL